MRSIRSIVRNPSSREYILFRCDGAFVFERTVFHPERILI